MEGIINELNKEIEMQGNMFAEQSKLAMGDVSSFFSAVDWSERWIQGLLAYHALLLLIILLYRKNATVQFTLMFSMIALGRMSQHINSFLASHWSSFSNVNYFDENGFFISVMFSGPMILLAMIALVNIIVILFNMVVKVKRQQLRSQAEGAKKKRD